MNDDLNGTNKQTPSQYLGERPTVTDCLRYLKRRSAAGNWFAFYRDYLEVMSRDAALLVQDILNHIRRKPKSDLAKTKRREGWTLYTVGYAEKSLKMSKETQDRVLEELQGYGKGDKTKKKSDRSIIDAKAFAEVSRFGLPAKRYIRIHLLKIEQAIDAVKIAKHSAPQIGLNPPNIDRVKSPDLGQGDRTDPPNTKYKGDKNKGGIPPSGGTRLAPLAPPPRISALQQNSIDEECLRFAQQLYKALRDAKRQVLGKPHIWANDFRLLRDQDQQTDISAVLDFYASNCSKENQERLKLPAVASGKQFRKCYNWIVDRMTIATTPKGRKRKEKVSRIEETDLGGGRSRSRIITEDKEWIEEGEYVEGDDGRRHFVPKEEINYGE